MTRRVSEQQHSQKVKDQQSCEVFFVKYKADVTNDESVYIEVHNRGVSKDNAVVHKKDEQEGGLVVQLV